MDINQKISKFRNLMQQHQLAAYIIPSSDPHLSEYVANHWKSRGHFSGFTGSAGTLVITLDESGLWTDGRYFIQAEAQLSNSEIKLFRMALPNVPTVSAYLASVLKEGDRIGFDGKLFSIHQVKEMEKLFFEKSIEIDSRQDLVSILWENRPAIPATEAFVHEVQYTGFTCAEKLGQVRAILAQKDADGYVMNLLDSIAWLFNIRAADVEFNPMVISYGVVLKDEAYLFVNEVRINEKVRQYLKENGVTIKSYDEIDAFLSTLTDCRLVCDYGSLNYSLYEVLSHQAGVVIVNEADIVTKLKAIKNEVEIKNTKLAQIKDGCAVVHTILHIEDLLNKNEKVTEYDVTELLEHYRLQQKDSYGSSFSAIVGYLENAAMMHYSPKKESSRALEQKGFLLIDSGGHYLDGTTDLTRTFTLGKTSKEAKKHYTLVLKAHIGLSVAKFQKGCTGGNLDILSRQFLWAEGLDYRCGTGHGVGFFGAIHEGPQQFRLNSNVVLEKGMMLTNEPGIYEEGKHGIRIENTLLVVEDQVTEYGEFYKFETISYFPIDTKSILLDMLTPKEIAWLNEYHEMVYANLAPHLEGLALAWLTEKTKAI